MGARKRLRNEELSVKDFRLARTVTQYYKYYRRHRRPCHRHHLQSSSFVKHRYMYSKLKRQTQTREVRSQRREIFLDFAIQQSH